jgi:4'-phosphopantetheinyl transferase EntD
MVVLPELQQLLEPGVCCFASAIPVVAAELYAVERHAARSFSDRRVAEFAAGRHCAHRALMQLGVNGAAVPVRQDRSPVWPPDIVGSISHSRTCAVAIAAHATENLLSLGVDVEETEPIEEELMEQIGTQSEYTLLRGAGCVSHELVSRLLFSLKEASFKCLYQWSGAFPDFADLRLLDMGSARDFAMGRLMKPTGEIAERVVGKFVVGREHICSTAVLRRSGTIRPQ